MPASQSTIFITGVSQGLGHALAVQWLEQGATVYGCSRRQPEDLAAREHFHHVCADLDLLPTLRTKPSGSFQDLRDLV